MLHAQQHAIGRRAATRRSASARPGARGSARSASARARRRLLLSGAITQTSSVKRARDLLQHRQARGVDAVVIGAEDAHGRGSKAVGQQGIGRRDRLLPCAHSPLPRYFQAPSTAPAAPQHTRKWPRLTGRYASVCGAIDVAVEAGRKPKQHGHQQRRAQRRPSSPAHCAI